MRETCTSGSTRGWRAADSNPLLVALLYRPIFFGSFELLTMPKGMAADKQETEEDATMQIADLERSVSLVEPVAYPRPS